MNLGYLYSIINLYIKNEKDNRKCNLLIEKNNDNILFSFNMQHTNHDKTTLTLPLDIVLLNKNEILKLYKNNLIIIDEKYDTNDNICEYLVKFQNGRQLLFRGFTLLEINDLRNSLYNITLFKDEIRIKFDNNENHSLTPNLKLKNTGYTSFLSLFVNVLFTVDALLIILWVTIRILT